MFINFLNLKLTFSSLFSTLSYLLFFLIYFSDQTSCFTLGFHTPSNRNISLNNSFNLYPDFCCRKRPCSPFTLNSWRSIETVINTGDYFLYDPNCIKYRKAKYWRDKTDEELQEEIRKVRKVLRKIDECIKVKDPSLLPDSKKNAKRTQAQLLFLLHERHLNSLRNSQKNNKDKNIAK